MTRNKETSFTSLWLQMQLHCTSPCDASLASLTIRHVAARLVIYATALVRRFTVTATADYVYNLLPSPNFSLFGEGDRLYT